jgi:hypothetical protein
MDGDKDGDKDGDAEAEILLGKAPYLISSMRRLPSVNVISFDAT